MEAILTALRNCSLLDPEFKLSILTEVFIFQIFSLTIPSSQTLREGKIKGKLY
jgi:hypothetical protein